jgi:hypothetical protein
VIPSYLSEFPIIILAVLISGLSGCGRDSESARILKLVSGMADSAEDRDVEGVLASLAADYQDFEGRDKPATRELLRERFGVRAGIVIHILHARIGAAVPEGPATMEADVVISSGGAEILRKLARFLGELFKFKLELKKEDGSWRVSRAGWEVVTPSELFPESRPLLKKLYPYL